MTGTAAQPGTRPGQDVDRLELVVLDVSRIHPYEHNPRRAPNAEYDRIKASIRADGLGQPLVVTQRPGDPDYIVHAGGNTRLRVLRELFEETSDRRFAEVPCVIRQWTREADVLLAHLKENDLRGELTFLDKALAVADARRFLAEGAEEPLTQARLAEVLQRHGYGLSQGLISQMAYAVERLVPLLPQALQGGIGRPQVAKIRALDRAARAIWLERSVDTEVEYDQAFEALCRRYDTADWDLASLRRALEAEIAERADISIHAVSLEIDARMSGRQGESLARRMTVDDSERDGEVSQREQDSGDSSKASRTAQETESAPPRVGTGDTAPEPSTSVDESGE
ncbi:MAG TPA: ParB family protein, partial [Pseudomonadales bacterium]